MSALHSENSVYACDYSRCWRLRPFKVIQFINFDTKLKPIIMQLHISESCQLTSTRYILSLMLPETIALRSLRLHAQGRAAKTRFLAKVFFRF